MAEFKTTEGKPLTTATMRVQGKKRLHLVGVGADKKVLAIESTNAAVVAGQLTALFDGPRGIWTEDRER